MKKLLLLISAMAISCQKSDPPQKPEQDIQSQSQEKTETVLPICSDGFDYSNKDENGYFIYGNDFGKSDFGPKSARLRASFSDGEILVSILETKPQGDEHTEPVVKLFTSIGKSVKDSLSVHETIDWEGHYHKRFCISKDRTISVNEEQIAPDVENIDEQGNSPIDSSFAKATYRIQKDGKFKKISSSGNID
ncbi:hypothetical protein HUK80_08090 [Flavobacterium sp. MAH-1]|uniref:Lipoprotein n=1 Tax=Flavobacterium agri TaxID=2743471 RepID=A0A7Y8Y2T0_9FLAO|nr:hypothetical protein [Flavobacterium agri]NUY80849.1 hypothetical protein [Flavobacterium agri]NYA70873.1 hypothetical protein [Flavobacterium agri]